MGRHTAPPRNARYDDYDDGSPAVKRKNKKPWILSLIHI